MNTPTSSKQWVAGETVLAILYLGNEINTSAYPWFLKYYPKYLRYRITCWWMDEGNVYTLKCYLSIKDLRWDLRVSVIYGQKNIHLDGSLILWPFSKIIVIGSVLGHVSSPTMCSWPDLQYQKHVPFCEVGHKSSRMCLGAFLFSVPVLPTRAYLAMPVSIEFTGFIAG